MKDGVRLAHGELDRAAEELHPFFSKQGLRPMACLSACRNIATLRCRYFFATTATFIEAGKGCIFGGLKPACASMSEYSANV